MTGRTRLLAFLLVAGLTLSYGEMMRSLTSHLGSRVDGGVVTLELAGLRGCEAAVLACFEGGGELEDLLPTVRLQLLLDFGFLLLYPLAVGLGCLLAAPRLHLFGHGLALGRTLAVGQLAAGLFDALENLALLRLLGLWRQGGGGAIGAWGELAAVFATIKFALVGLGLLFVLSGLIRWLWQRSPPEELLRPPGSCGG